jgi:hypothetical protein
MCAPATPDGVSCRIDVPEKVLRPAVAAARTKPIGQNSTPSMWQRTKLKSSLTKFEQGLVTVDIACHRARHQLHLMALSD